MPKYEVIIRVNGPETDEPLVLSSEIIGHAHAFLHAHETCMKKNPWPEGWTPPKVEERDALPFPGMTVRRLDD